MENTEVKIKYLKSGYIVKDEEHGVLTFRGLVTENGKLKKPLQFVFLPQLSNNENHLIITDQDRVVRLVNTIN
ncbi:MAG: hypothetical protein ACOYXT_10005 [Bacteroidota bacterium]